MAIWSAEIDGLDKLLRDLKDLPTEALDDVIKASVRGGKAILDLARQRVPSSKYGKQYYGKGENKGKSEWNHLPGLLKKSIKMKKPSKAKVRKFNVTTSVGFEKGAAYGVPLELGHRLVFFGTQTGTYVKERPFLRSSADDKKNYVVDEQIKGINAALDAFGRKG